MFQISAKTAQFWLRTSDLKSGRNFIVTLYESLWCCIYIVWNLSIFSDLEKFAEKLTESESNTKKVGSSNTATSSTGVTDTTKKTSDESSSTETTATTNEGESEKKSDKTDEMDLD